MSGWKGYLQKRVDEMKEHARLQRYISPFSVALIYAQMGEKNQALTWLEKTYEERNYRLLFIKVDARLDSLRSEPRFLELVKRIDETCELAAKVVSASTNSGNAYQVAQVFSRERVASQIQATTESSVRLTFFNLDGSSVTHLHRICQTKTRLIVSLPGVGSSNYDFKISLLVLKTR